jgi:hypothetical protein
MSLLDFLARLDAEGVSYRLAHKVSGQVTVEVETPGRWWEFHFGAEGFVDAEVYGSEGTIPDERAFEELWRWLAT